MAARFVATADVGALTDCSLGCTGFRRLVIRWEYHAENFLGTVQLGCINILLRQM